MASEAQSQTDNEPEEGGTSEPGNKKKPVVVAVLMMAVILGGTVGGVLIGPRLAGAVSGTEPAPGSESSPADDSIVAGKFFELENLIVNPAGSRGERFLMVSVAFEVPDDETLTLLHEREIQVRDVVSAMLGARTMEALTETGARETLKNDLSELVAPLAGRPPWMRVYLPRFVIQ